MYYMILLYYSWMIDIYTLIDIDNIVGNFFSTFLVFKVKIMQFLGNK